MQNSLPSGFCFLNNIDPSVIECSYYASEHNFLGRIVKGYTTTRIICTTVAAQRLKEVHDFFKNQGYRLVIYDGYRPQRAVDEFKAWGLDELEQATKALYYPTLEKKEVFQQGYLAKKHSTHSRGSTFDLTLIEEGRTLQSIQVSKRFLANGEEIPFLDNNTVDMGSSFDLFHEVSHHDSTLVSDQCNEKRNFLRKVMMSHGFKPCSAEWWHYTLGDEPFPDAYFDFVVDGNRLLV